MQKLIDYILKHADRGECQCGACCDKGPDREAPKHSVDVHFFWVSKMGEPTAEGLRDALKEYPRPERLASGPSYIEIGGEIGDQGLALQLIGLGELVGLWKTVTPKKLGLDGVAADQMAGAGYVMTTGLREAA